MHPGQQFNHWPGGIKFAAGHAKSRRCWICVVVIVPAFSSSEQSDEAQIRRGIVEIMFTNCVICAIDDCVEENVRRSLDKICNAAPCRAQDKHENGNPKDYAGKSEAENVAIEPIVADIRRECRERVGIFRFPRVVIDIPQKDPPQAFENRAVRVAFHVRVTMMLTVHCNPLFCINSCP